MSAKCKYCENKYQLIYNKKLMCKKCREEYDCYLEEKADAERDQRTFKEIKDREWEEFIMLNMQTMKN